MSSAVGVEGSHSRGRGAAILAMYGVRASTALWIGARLSHAAARVGGSPAGDARMFDDGGVLLLEVVRVARPHVPSLVFGVVAALVVAAFAGLVPLAMVIHAAGSGRDARLHRLFPAALDAFGALAWLEVVAVIAQGLVLALAVAIGATVRAQAGWTGRAEDACLSIAVIVGLLGVLSFRLIHDLARVLVVARGKGVYASVTDAWSVFRTSWKRIFSAWIWRALLALAALGSAAFIGAEAGVRGPVAFVAGALVHQMGALVAVGWRASFLEFATGVAAPGESPLAADQR